MALSGLGLFLLEACAGTAFLLLFFPPAVLGRGFFTLHGSLAAIFAGLALLVRPAGLPMPVLASGTVLLALYTLAAHAGTGRAGPAAARRGARAARPGALGRVALVAPREAGDAWTVVGALAGGLFFGAVLVIMNLGHWYLVSRSIPFAASGPRGGALRRARSVPDGLPRRRDGRAAPLGGRPDPAVSRAGRALLSLPRPVGHRRARWRSRTSSGGRRSSSRTRRRPAFSTSR